MIIGVAGFYGAGKGEVVKYLAERSFYPLSLSDVLREELRRRGEPESRERMILAGNALREREGPGALARRLVDRIPANRNCVVDSIRHPKEVEELRSLGRPFLLVWVDATAETRAKRIKARAREGDPRDLGELQAYETRERGGSKHSQQLDKIRMLADHVVRNDGSLSDLHDRVRIVLQGALHFERPDWDEYFMNIASVVATRSNCVKRKVAALIILDRRIIATGYNGTPRSVTNCNEGGCPRCASFAPGGADLGECLCSHAEENAIVQAAYHGVRVAGGSVYTTFCPCLICTKMIINAGLKEVVYASSYPVLEASMGMFRQAGVSVRKSPKHAGCES